MVQVKTKIIYNKKIRANFFHLAISASGIAKQAAPGQFIEIKVCDGYEPLLRRPFSIHKLSGSEVHILYEVLGEGTEVLSRRRPGEYLDVIGPLGKGFNYNVSVLQCCSVPVIVAGGIGVAPLVFLAEELKGLKLFVLIGAKTKSQILCEKEFQHLGCDVKISTDDGSKGFKGKVTDLLQIILRENEITSQGENEIYACGPKPMLKEISRISQEYRIPAQISLEEHMACGIGACLGCVVKTKQGFQRVCKEGPVFKADEIVW